MAAVSLGKMHKRPWETDVLVDAGRKRYTRLRESSPWEFLVDQVMSPFLLDAYDQVYVDQKWGEQNVFGIWPKG